MHLRKVFHSQCIILKEEDMAEQEQLCSTQSVKLVNGGIFS